MVRALRKPMIQMIFSSCSRNSPGANSVKLQSSRKGIENAIADSRLAAKRFARQHCRARIETLRSSSHCLRLNESPGSNAGRGLKQMSHVYSFVGGEDSPGSKAGRGLKPFTIGTSISVDTIRPAAMPGAD